MFPEDRNQILIRLENLSDLFDGSPTTSPHFNVLKYATDLYKNNNGGTAPTSVVISERTLSNNQSMDEMKENKFKWKSADSSNSRTAEPFENDSKTYDNVQLQPQRIRLFRVSYNTEAPTMDAQILTE